MNEIQERVDALAYINNLSDNMQNNLLGLVSQAAELCSEYNRATDHGKIQFTSNKDFEMTIGKIFHCLILIANSAGIDLEDALNETLKT